MSSTKQRGYSLEGWPRKGYDGPQPWEHDALGISREDRENVGSDENRTTPVVTHEHKQTAHNIPILTSGSAHESVHELGRKLGALGFPNSVSNGENPFGTVDQSVLTAVASFRQHYGVRDDPSPFGGNTPQGRATAEAHIGPWTTEAILRAYEDRD